MSRFLVVELDGHLDRSRHVGLFLNIRQLPGIRSVTDLSAISEETLQSYLLQPEPEPPVEPRVMPQQLEWAL